MLEKVKLSGETSGHFVFTGEQVAESFFGLFNSRRQMMRVVDRTGVVRLQRELACISAAILSEIKDELTL
jgi:hypothetical protein